MRYHFTKPTIYRSNYGETYHCNHPIYDTCTLYLIGDKGLAVIQQKRVRKNTRWEKIDEWLTDPIYLSPDFYFYFNKHADYPDENGLYPTVTVRSIMHALGLKPPPKERWETVFDRTTI